MMRHSKVSAGTGRFAWRLWVLSLVLLTGCAGRGEIVPADTAGAIVVLGFAVEGRPVSTLGYYYVLNFLDADEVPLQVVVRPRARDNQIIVDELPPGDWTLASFAARPSPGLDGFELISLRQRPVDLMFPVVEGSVQVLSHQLVIDHGQTRAGLTLTQPRMTPLTERTLTRLERRIERLGPEWQRIQEPVGVVPEREEPSRRGLLERLFGD